MRLSTRFPIMCALFLIAGCFQREVRIVPEPDGSGTLEILTTLSAAFLRYAEAHAGLPPDRIWFHEQALSHSASQYGDGVRYLEHGIEVLDGAKRFRVQYRFDRISDLSLELNLNAPFLLRPPAASAVSPPRFRFEQEPGVLRVIPPDITPPPVPPPMSALNPPMSGGSGGNSLSVNVKTCCPEATLLKSRPAPHQRRS